MKFVAKNRVDKFFSQIFNLQIVNINGIRIWVKTADQWSVDNYLVWWCQLIHGSFVPIPPYVEANRSKVPLYLQFYGDASWSIVLVHSHLSYVCNGEASWSTVHLYQTLYASASCVMFLPLYGEGSCPKVRMYLPPYDKASWSMVYLYLPPYGEASWSRDCESPPRLWGSSYPDILWKLNYGGLPYFAWQPLKIRPL